MSLNRVQAPTRQNLCYVFDLDGTLADCTHRLNLIHGENKDWDAFFKACHRDRPIIDVVEVLEILHEQGYMILILTGRSDVCREETLQWLDDNGISFHQILMRKQGDRRPDDILKLEMLHNWQLEFPHKVVLGIFEDRTRVCKALREQNFRVYQVANGDY